MLDGDTALSVACKQGHTETAKVLLDKGAIIDYQNEVRMVNVCSHDVIVCIASAGRSVTSCSSMCRWP